MEIPLKAHVECTDGVCGRCVVVLMNPVVDQVTHLVVREDASPHTEYIVPVDVVSATTAETIGLRCSKAELEKMDPFVKTQYVEAQTSQMYPGSYSGSGMAPFCFFPYATSAATEYVRGEYLQIRPGSGGAPRYARRGDRWRSGQNRRIPYQPGERLHYPFGDARRTSVGTEGCNDSPFGNAGRSGGMPCS